MNRIMGFAVVFVLSTWQSSLALVIGFPKDGDTFKEGDIVKIVAELSDDDPEILYVHFNVTRGLDHCPNEITTHPRYECSFIIPPGSPQVIKISALGKKEYGAISSPWISINVILPPTLVLQQLKSFTGATLIFSKLEQNIQIYLKGIYSDGIERDLKSSSSGTTYTSSNENVVTVSSEGLVTAKGSGKARVIALNSSKTLSLNVKVEIKIEPPTDLYVEATDIGIKLDWQISEQDPAWVTDYKIFRSENSDGIYEKLIVNLPKGTTTYTDITALNGKTYYYAIQANSSIAQSSSKLTEWVQGLLP